MQELSFAAEVKDELARLEPQQECCRRMELAALLRACGNLELGGPDRLAVRFVTQHPSVVRKFLKLLRAGFSLRAHTMVTRRRRLRKNLEYVVRIPPQPSLSGMLEATGILGPGGQLLEWLDLPDLEHDHCCRAYLRGTFLGTGWVAAPVRQHHLEMSTSSSEAAEALGQMLFRYGLPVRLAFRKEVHLLYLKDAEHISRMLNVLGAHQSLLKYEDVRAMKEMKNRVNRQVNAETANLSKTVEASARQMEVLERLKAEGGFRRLSPALREMAQLRLSHPDASLKELGELCRPPVTKSAANHRMRQLMQIAATDLP